MFNLEELVEDQNFVLVHSFGEFENENVSLTFRKQDRNKKKKFVGRNILKYRPKPTETSRHIEIMIFNQ